MCWPYVAQRLSVNGRAWRRLERNDRTGAGIVDDGTQSDDRAVALADEMEGVGREYDVLVECDLELGHQGSRLDNMPIVGQEEVT